jgi:uncharacterized membrane protein YgaE (UPF0421/DUF939 family)
MIKTYDVSVDEMVEVTQEKFDQMLDQLHQASMRHAISNRLRGASTHQLHQILQSLADMHLHGDGKLP